MQNSTEATTVAAVTATATRENPLLTPSTLPFEAPPFDRIQDEDYEPAMEQGMAEHLAEIEAIADQTAAPSFANTIVAMERGHALLDRAANTFFNVLSANSNDTLQDVAQRIAPKLAAHFDDILLNGALFHRVDALFRERDRLALSAEEKRLLEYHYRQFVRNGALLNDADKTRLRALNEEEATLSAEFQTKLQKASMAAALVVGDPLELDGLSDADIDAAAEAAKARGLGDKWLLPLHNTTQHPAQQRLRNRSTRERLFVASIQRAERGDVNDTRALVRRLAQIRAERSALLGYPNTAAYVLEEEMSKTPEARTRLLTDVASAAIRRARAEQADMQTLIDREQGGFTLAPWDWQHYAERVRLEKYALDASQLRPYLELNRVLEDGVFWAANQLYGLTFDERYDIPVYHPDVRVFDVMDSDGSALALFYVDLFKRDNKDGGARSNEFVQASGLRGTKPVVINVANLAKPAPGEPALLDFDDVITLFHEFGHALHAMFARVQYPTSLHVPADFSELPSQFNEHWAFEPRVLAQYAKHHRTGAPMPEELVARFRRTRTFNQGFAATEYLAAALLDLAWHTIPEDAPPPDVGAFEAATLARHHFDEVPILPRYRTTYFAHIWDSDYQANYGSYMWAEVLDDDAYAWFEEHGGLTRENGQRFRDLVLERGSNGYDLAASYREFRGRDPNVEALLENRGLSEKSTPR